MASKLENLTLPELELVHKLRSGGIKPPTTSVVQAQINAMPIVEWAEHYYYIPETGMPVVLEPLQTCLLPYILDVNSLPPFGFTEILWTSVKKSAKTATAGIVARYCAETWGFKQEVYVLANDEEQAKGRIYQSIKNSIELDPRYDKKTRILTDEHGRQTWRVIEDGLTYLPTGSTITVVNIDYRGSAGGNPSASFWSELWGYTTEKHGRLFDEMTPVPTRGRSIRWIETYAGFEGESKLLRSIWDQAQKQGRRLTRQDLLQAGHPWPYDDPDDELPLWVHEPSRTFAYIDQNLPGKPPRARRMSWLQGARGDAYYQQQASQATMTPESYDRFHNNLWQSPETAFIPIETYYRNYNELLPALKPDSDSPELCIMGVDAAVSGDCCAVVVVTRNPLPGKFDQACLRYYKKFDPPRGGKIDYGAPGGLEETIRELIEKYYIYKIVYDEYQLHDMMTRIRREGLTACHVFSQGADRMSADKQLYDCIIQQRWQHHDTPGTFDTDFSNHIKHASKQQNAREDTKLRIIKNGSGEKIDLVVAASMATHAVLELLL